MQLGEGSSEADYQCHPTTRQVERSKNKKFAQLAPQAISTALRGLRATAALSRIRDEAIPIVAGSNPPG